MALILVVPTIVSRANDSQWKWNGEWKWDGEWKLGGQNLKNTRNQATERYLKPENVASLSPKWVFTTGGEISATPAVVDGAIYLPDWAGNLFKIDAQTGAQIWSNTIANYISDPSIPKASSGTPYSIIPTAMSRTSPAVKGNKVIIGSQGGAYLMAINKDTGKLIWKTKLDSHPKAVITQSPAIYRNRVYVGVASLEEGDPFVNPNYKCCTFRGSMASVDLTTGKILWKTYTVPDNGGQPGGYSGVGVWGSTPAIDPKRKSVYIATGNNYEVPQTAKDCIAKLSSPTPSDQSKCLDPNNYIDAIMALDLDTGAIKWSNKLEGYDTWNVACQFGLARNCPDPKGEDYDFAQGPMLFTVKNAGQRRDLIGAGQKSGVFWALDRDNGQVVWSQIVGPGGTTGGIQWGSATDGQQIYVAISNAQSQEYKLQPSGKTTKGGSWSALDAATGKIIWQIADPAGAKDQAPMTVANGVVYAGSLASGQDSNNMYALDAKTGKILWDFNSGGSVVAGAAVVNGTVYWGSGYSHYGLGVFNNKLYAFTVSKSKMR
ncbi:outer membrane protein assembly factor BamB family protein [Nostoc sp.]|uniref:outer membrane protein assembly factor BamB family protein n=1 Tax=Nostoc sp. TaxID=1180 RepID=UPI002FF4A99F